MLGKVQYHPTIIQCFLTNANYGAFKPRKKQEGGGRSVVPSPVALLRTLVKLALGSRGGYFVGGRILQCPALLGPVAFCSPKFWQPTGRKQRAVDIGTYIDEWCVMKTGVKSNM